MTRYLSLALALGFVSAGLSLGFAQEALRPPVHWHHRAHHPTRHPASHPVTPEAVAQPAPAPTPQSPDSAFKPYAQPGVGDDDGISRDPDDCMKGCIGGNPG